MKEPMTFKLEPELKKQLEKYSKLVGVSKSALIRMALIEKINKLQGEK